MGPTHTQYNTSVFVQSTGLFGLVDNAAITANLQAEADTRQISRKHHQRKKTHHHHHIPGAWGLSKPLIRELAPPSVRVASQQTARGIIHSAVLISIPFGVCFDAFPLAVAALAAHI